MLVTFQFVISDIKAAEQSPCVEMGCECDPAKKKFIPLACYDNEQGCCPGPVPKYLKDHYEDLQTSGAIKSLLDTNIEIEEKLTRCKPDETNSAYIICDGIKYKPVTEVEVIESINNGELFKNPPGPMEKGYKDPSGSSVKVPGQ